jgi:hypothetical protein
LAATGRKPGSATTITATPKSERRQSYGEKSVFEVEQSEEEVSSTDNTGDAG